MPALPAPIEPGRRARIGVIGSGMIARSFVTMVQRHHADLRVTKVLTRRPLGSVTDACFAGLLTDSVQALAEASDVVVECTGDAVHATPVIEQLFAAGLPVVTMNAELHVTTGSHLAGLGYLTEAEGDQPGSTAALHEEALQMGFRPLVYGNMKGFRNLDPTPEDMAYWAARQQISIPNTTGATDGTKIQAEQALLANFVGGTITRQGLEGPASENLAEAGRALAVLAEGLGRPIADYVLAVNWAPTGVFMVCRHDDDLAGLLNYFKLGSGPYYLLVKPFHLCSLEIVKTVRRVLAGGRPLLNNSTAPTIGVGAVAKRDFAAGQRIAFGSGGFELRGEAVKLSEAPRHVSIGIVRDAVLTRTVAAGQLITWDDLEMPETRAAILARDIVERAAARAG